MSRLKKGKFLKKLDEQISQVLRVPIDISLTLFVKMSLRRVESKKKIYIAKTKSSKNVWVFLYFYF